MGKGFWIGTIIVVVILGITAGIIVHVYDDERTEASTEEVANELVRLKEASVKDKEKKSIDMINVNNEENEIIVETSSNELKTTPNTILVFESYYSKCGHSQIRSEKIAKDNVNKTKDEIKKIYSDWEIKSFSSDKIELYKNENSLCGNHFVVKEKDGYVTVYNINKDGEEVIRDKTDISTKYLPKDDNDLLQNGIKANSTSQLEQILADFE